MIKVKSKDFDEEVEALLGAKEPPKKMVMRLNLRDDDYQKIAEIAKNNNKTIPEIGELLLINSLKRYQELEDKAKK